MDLLCSFSMLPFSYILFIDLVDAKIMILSEPSAFFLFVSSAADLNSDFNIFDPSIVLCIVRFQQIHQNPSTLEYTATQQIMAVDRKEPKNYGCVLGTVCIGKFYPSRFHLCGGDALRFLRETP